MTLKENLDIENETASPEELAVLAKVAYGKVLIDAKDLKDKSNETSNDKSNDTSSSAQLGFKGAQKSLIIKDENLKNKLSNWEILTDIPRTKNGFYSSLSGMQAVAYRNNQSGEIVIAYRGTDSGLDICNSDGPIAFHVKPLQQKAAQAFYERVKSKYPDSPIVVTGHSLGGALAQRVAYKNDLRATTYNAPGVQKANKLTSSKIVNYVNLNDPIACYGLHVGKTLYYLPKGEDDENYSTHGDFINHDFSKYNPLPPGIIWTHKDAATLQYYATNKSNKQMRSFCLLFAKESYLSLCLEKLKQSNVLTDASDKVKFHVGNEQYALEVLDGKIVNCSYPKHRAPKEYPAVYKQDNGKSLTGGAAPIKPAVTKRSRTSSKGDKDGHWITTKKGKHVFIEDEEPRRYTRFFIYDLMEIDESGLGDFLSRPRTYEELQENSRKGDLMKNVDENKYWNYDMNPVTKVGVFDYLGSQISYDLIPDKVYKVYRSAEEIASPEALRTLRLLPVVDEHQMLGQGDGLMPAEQKGVHGVLGEKAYLQDGYLYSDMRIFSEHLKEQINNGKRELSLGYRCEYDASPGVYNGIPYDMRQVKIRYNHLALVDKGRMGSDVCVMDSKIGFDMKGYSPAIEIDYGIPEVFFSNYSPEVLEVRNDPEMIAYLSRKKGD